MSARSNLYPASARACRCTKCGDVFGWVAWANDGEYFGGICPDCWSKESSTCIPCLTVPAHEETICLPDRESCTCCNPENAGGKG